MSNPAFTTDPTISITSGSGAAGSILTAVDGTPITGATISGRQWFRAGVAIAGASGSTYTVQTEDTLLPITFENFISSDASNAVVPLVPRVAYRYYKLVVLRNSKDPVDNNSSLAEIEVKDEYGTVITGSWAAAIAGNVAYLNDGNPSTSYNITNGSFSTRAVTFTAAAAFKIGRMRFLSRGSSTGASEGPGSFRIYGSNTAFDTDPAVTTGWTELLSVTYPGGVNAYGYSNSAYLDWVIPPIEGLSIAVTGATKRVGSQDFTLSTSDLTGAGGTTQVRVVNVSTGRVVIDWQAPATLSVPAGGFYRFDIRNSGQPAAIVSTDVDIVSHGIQPTTLGMNMGYLYDSVVTSDLVRSGSWAYNYDQLAAPGYEGNGSTFVPGSTVGMGLNGLPQSLPSGAAIRLRLPKYLPESMIGTSYSFVTSDGVIADVGKTGGDKAAAAARGFTKGATTSSGGVQTTTFTVGSQYNATAASGSCFLTITAITSGMSQASFAPNGYGSQFPAELKDDLGIAKIIRTMTPAGINSRVTVTDPTNRASENDIGWQGSSGLPVETSIDLCNDLEADLWLNIPIAATDDLIELHAEFCRDRLHLDRKVFIELSNEVWNRSFPQYYIATYQGLSRGYGPDGVTPATAVPEIVLSNGNANSNILTINVATNDKIMCPISGQGILVYRALGDFAAGQALPTTGLSDANFALVYTNVQCSNARWRYQSSRSKEAWSIFETAMGTSRIRRALMNRPNSPDAWQMLLDWDDCQSVTDTFGHALYFDCNLTYTGSTTALRSATNQADWIAAYMTAMNDAVAPSRAQAKQCAEWLDRYLVTKERQPGSIIFGVYEGGRNEGPPTGAWTEAGGLATATQWWTAARRDAGLIGVIDNWTAAIATETGGPLCYFCDFQSIGTTGQRTGWGAKEYVGQTGAPVWTSLASFTSPV